MSKYPDNPKINFFSTQSDDIFQSHRSQLSNQNSLQSRDNEFTNIDNHNEESYENEEKIKTEEFIGYNMDNYKQNFQPAASTLFKEAISQQPPADDGLFKMIIQVLIDNCEKQEREIQQLRKQVQSNSSQSMELVHLKQVILQLKKEKDDLLDLIKKCQKMCEDLQFENNNLQAENEILKNQVKLIKYSPQSNRLSISQEQSKLDNTLIIIDNETNVWMHKFNKLQEQKAEEIKVKDEYYSDMLRSFEFQLQNQQKSFEIQLSSFKAMLEAKIKENETLRINISEITLKLNESKVFLSIKEVLVEIGVLEIGSRNILIIIAKKLNKLIQQLQQ